MRNFLLICAVLSCALNTSAQQTPITYKKMEVMMPMRDGIHLFTSIYVPTNAEKPVPFLIQRTPYGSQTPQDYDIYTNSFLVDMVREGYVIVVQDVRGRSKSEGTFEIHQPLIHAGHPKAVDESTDTYDAIDWLVKNIPNNNGKAGILGISYPGWLALVGAVDHHPALKASSEQACMSDLFLGDDFHHNGAFRLSYGFEYTYELELDPSKGTAFPFGKFDLFDWYRDLGSLKNVNEKYFHRKIPTWNHFVDHPDYDSFWQANSTLTYVHAPEIPMLHVGGYYDQEDLNGPQLMYGAMEKLDSFQRNHIILGPWNHGQWAGGKGDSLGKISFGSSTGIYFRQLQKKWFDFYLKGIGDGKFEEAYAFQTGSNQWKTYKTWPPKTTNIQNLYAATGNKATFQKPNSDQGQISFTSDPANPVPYRMLPIEQTYGRGSHWRPWQVEDQRFIYTRPDVISFMMDSLTADVSVTGTVTAHLFAATSGSDADWIVKLIDVYPDVDSTNMMMSGFQLAVAMEAFRGRYHNSFSKPEALVPSKPTEFTFSLHQINHTFRRGHHLMIQVQSTWFPVIDRNPQTYVPNIFTATERDFTKQIHTIYFNATYPTRIELPMAE